MNAPRSSFFQVDYPDYHLGRMREILKAHPEVKKLFGVHPLTALYAILLVSLQIGLGVWANASPWWLSVLLALTIGATLSHALFVIIHEATHNLVFKKPILNRVIGIVANFPQLIPSAMQFFKYHMMHHNRLAQYEHDLDVPNLVEAQWVGNSRFKKFLVFFFFSFIQGAVRPSRLKKEIFWDKWFIINLVAQLSFSAVLFYFTGPLAFLYLFLSTLFSIGFHPFGGRWIQEHYLQRENQETNSYYGPLNKFCFNMGYHNEHHDFMKVPWVNLPKVRQMAPEFYDGLFIWKSWTYCLVHFVWDKKHSLFDRHVRKSI